jgi:multisubunit Na+/H+ antiporter MnhG subunit
MKLPERAIPKWIVAHPQFCAWYLKRHAPICTTAGTILSLCFAVMGWAIENNWNLLSDIMQWIVMWFTIPVIVLVVIDCLTASEVEKLLEQDNPQNSV